LQGVQEGVGFGPGHLHLAARHVGDFVQNLNDDGAAGGDHLLRLVGFCRVV
jgi:hypothetical protein